MNLVFTQDGEGELSKEKIHIALLRGVNVGGHRRILMEELQDLFKELGYVDPRTYVQSGNVVFGAKPGKGHGKKITAAIAKRFGHDVPTVVIEAEEFARAVAANPLAGRAAVEKLWLYVGFFEGTPDSPEAVDDLPCAGGEIVELVDGCLYLAYPPSQEKSKLGLAVIERSLGVTATIRNWKTVNALLSMIDAP